MKKLKTISLIRLAVVSLIGFGFSSCSEDNEPSSSLDTIPVITKVFEAGDLNLTAVEIGYPNLTYVIQGSGLETVQKIYFNDVDTYFNQTFVTDNNIFVTIDLDTPYAGNVSNELKVVTASGKSAIHPILIAPPAPLIVKSFNPINAVEGDEITIYGDFFLNPVVSIGATEVPVISNTLKEIVIQAPANAEDKTITVTTISGEAISKEVIGSAIYDDVLYGDTGHWTWGGTDIFDTAYSDDTAQGTHSIQFTLGGWSGADMNFAPIDVTKYKAFRVRVKSLVDNSAASVNFVFGGWAYVVPKAMTNEWTYIEIPFLDIGNPTTFSQLTLQESGNFGGNSFLFDNMGFVLK
tara:strand:+ start:14931 stop:15980 length:1050 start_codon:yes stop_codon:yes gene_type:complete